jgi:hypothetical protein
LSALRQADLGEDAMKTSDKATSELVMLLSTKQSIETRRRLADLVIGGLLVAFAIGGFVM